MKPKICSLGVALHTIAAILLSGCGGGSVDISQTGPSADTSSMRKLLLTPGRVTDTNGRVLDVERGLMFVPESRGNPESRTIAFHFLRVSAREAQTPPRPPVFHLPGGPGSEADFTDPGTIDRIERLRKTRDYIYVSQRGNPRQPGITADLIWSAGAPPLDEPMNADAMREAARAAFTDTVGYWQARGTDLSGYDIMNITSDVYELREALGYDKIVLRGCSFGSQWSYAYMKRWPESVDRAFLSGVEPLDFAYDSPSWLWASMNRLAERAESDPDLASQMPEGGLIRALKTVIERIEAEPVTVEIDWPDTGEIIDVVVGADDVRSMLRSLGSLMQDSAYANLAHWPRFILEMHDGDYRFLAANAARMRLGSNRQVLIGALIDNSLGISPARDDQLLNEEEARWLGDINGDYRATRDVTPTPSVNDAFREDAIIDFPVLLLTGDLDWSTPIENAEHASRFLNNGHFVRVVNGTHCTESRSDEMPTHLREETAKIFEFIDADFDVITPSEFFDTLPDSLSLPDIDFAARTERTLYDEWLAGQD